MNAQERFSKGDTVAYVTDHVRHNIEFEDWRDWERVGGVKEVGEDYITCDVESRTGSFWKVVRMEGETLQHGVINLSNGEEYTEPEN